jgi:hypothetical protein
MIPVRARWLVCASAGGAALGHLLDELGALPGIHETAAVRLALLDPARAPGIALALVGAVVAALVADRLLSRGTVAATAALLCGQLVTATGLESVARGRLEAGFLEHGGFSAVGVQLLVAVLVVVAAVVTALVLQRIPPVAAATAAPAISTVRRQVNGFVRTARVSFQERAPPTAAPCHP